MQRAVPEAEEAAAIPAEAIPAGEAVTPAAEAEATAAAGVTITEAGRRRRSTQK